MSNDQVIGDQVIVVGVDGSPESDSAVDWARSVATDGARIVLVHAWEIPIVTGYDIVLPIDSREIEEIATKTLDEQVTRLADDRVEGVLAQGHAGRALVATADERDAGVIVVGHRGRGRMSMMLGSTANYVLHHGQRPVVVIRGEEIVAPRRIVVGVDDHDIDDANTENESTRALRWAYGLPGVEQVHVIHAWFLPALAVGMFTPAMTDLEQMDAAAAAIIDRVVDAVGPAPEGITVTREAVRGTPGFGLIEASRDTDLIVVGSRGRGGFKGLLLGSTSSEVAAHSHAPVAVIR